MGKSDKKKALARQKATSFYLPIFLAFEASHFVGHYLLGSSFPATTLVQSLLLSAFTYYNYTSILQAVEDDVSSVADKRSKDDSKKTPKKIAGSGSIDLFFLSNALKLLTLATPFFWKTVYLLPVYAAWKAYGMFTGAKSAMQGLAGGAPAPVTPDWEPAVEDEDDDTRKQKRANKRATKTR